MYTCDCGHWRCAQPVSRSTWFRHKMAKIMQAQMDVEDLPSADPLPVEDAPECDPQMDIPMDPEVKNPNNILGYFINNIIILGYPRIICSSSILLTNLCCFVKDPSIH